MLSVLQRNSIAASIHGCCQYISRTPWSCLATHVFSTTEKLHRRKHPWMLSVQQQNSMVVSSHACCQYNSRTSWSYLATHVVSTTEKLHRHKHPQMLSVQQQNSLQWRHNEHADKRKHLSSASLAFVGGGGGGEFTGDQWIPRTKGQ